jgi:LysR family glycine cleavage system transcriptional activator
MRRLPPLAAIRAFEAAARTENFTAAAAELGMTQAAVSYQVKSLEERLGAPLFIREKGRARLTPLGSRLLPALTSAFDTIEAAFATHREEDESLLTVTTTHTFANTWLAWRLGAFQMEHTDLAVRMTTSNELCDLRGGDADVAIRAGGGGWEGMEHHRLFESQFTPMASPDCIAMVERKLGRKLEPNDVPDQNLINPADDWWQQWFSDNGVPADEAVLRRRAGIRLENQANEGHAAMAGQGFALLTPLLWKGDVAAGRLSVPFPDRISQRGWAYWLVYPTERRLAPKIKRFREWLVAEMERSKADAAGGWPQPEAVAAE